LGDTLSSTVQVGDNSWRLTLGWVRPEPEPEPYILGLIWGLGSAFLISVLVIINQTFRRVDWLSTAVEKKTADLAKSEVHYRTIMASANDAIITADSAGNIVDWNQGAENMFGYTGAEVTGQPVSLLVPPKYLDRHRQGMQRVQSGVEPHLVGKTIELEGRRKNGVEFPAEISLAKWEVAEGRFYTAIIRDITKRKQAEQALRESEARYRTLAEAAQDMIFIIDREDRVTYVNNYAARQFSRSPDELIGQPRRALFPPDIADQQQASLRTVFETGQPLYVENPARFSEVTPWLETSLSPLTDETGQVYAVLGIARDVTARKQAEEEQAKLEKQFRQAQKMEAIGQLTAGIAHDFNNLIMAISGNAELMQIRLQPEDPLYKMTDTILHSGSRAAELIRQLLIFSRKQMMAPQIVGLNAIITEMNQMLARIIGEDIEVKLNLKTDLWPVKVDPAQIEQVVANLVVNARDAMPDGGKLILETTNVILDRTYIAGHVEVQPGEYVLLTVSDTGIGMSQEIQERLFEPFFTTKASGKGTGLGLATVYGIVKQSGGHIWVYSEEGQGATFKVYLPRTTEVASPASRPPTKETEGGHETILVVEDDAVVRDVARDVLRMQGYTVLEAEDSQQALQVAAQHTGPIHLLLTDVIMPGMSGKALAGELSRRYPRLKVIFMSGYSDEVISHHKVLDPGVVFIQKPFSFMEMARKVREMLG
jgi:PAS domain S-box-containing protein